MATNMAVTGDTPITIKISIGDAAKKIKLPLKDLTPEVLPTKLFTLLNLPSDKTVTLERFSDSAGNFVQLDSNNPAVYKTLVRAAKAKLKLRLKATVEGQEQVTAQSEAHEIPVKKWEPETQRKNIGAGIFDFKDAHSAPNLKAPATANEAPLPRPFNTSPYTYTHLSSPELQATLRGYKPLLPIASQVMPAPTSTPPQMPSCTRSSIRPTWSVFCNECDAVMNGDHYHCGICDAGDYDLCMSCVKAGKICPGTGHWLVKRTFKDGHIVSSTTERFMPPKKTAITAPAAAPVAPVAPMVAPRRAPLTFPPVLPMRFGPPPGPCSKAAEDILKKSFGVPKLPALPVLPALPIRHATSSSTLASTAMPGAFAEDKPARAADDLDFPTRTCNNCITISADAEFVHCNDCEDFDLCFKCHLGKKHGHHPGHSFSRAVKDQQLTAAQIRALAAGNGVRHLAVCDGCDNNVVGVRHKCFQCPDFDYCSDCFRTAHETHPGHRFAAVYEPIAARSTVAAIHSGIYCDGPACSSQANQRYIQGVRYKCVVCPDTDFCANCEALPVNSHNHTHPLLKIVSPVAGLHISTASRERSGKTVSGLGDDAATQRAASAPSAAAKPTSSASSVKTVAHIEPTTTDRFPKVEKSRFVNAAASTAAVSQASDELKAHFVSDTIPDGIVVRDGTRFTQVWNMVNPGPSTWPAGCSVRYVGGDNMLNLDEHKPCNAAAMDAATETNVVGREVLPGEKVAFKVVLKAPPRDGNAISYWRLKTADGLAFGHRLWCDIIVRKVPESQRLVDRSAAAIPNPGLLTQTHAAVDAAQSNLRALQAQVELTRRRASDNLAAALAEQRRVFAETQKHQTPAVTAWVEKVPPPAQAAQRGPVMSAEAKNDAPVASTSALAEFAAKPEVKEEVSRKATESPMVFPTLDKESPASSTYLSTTTGDSKAKVATVEDEQTGVITSAEKPATAPEEEEETFQDIASEIEVLSASSNFSDNDDGFLTDEEYDILDASDQETLA